VNAHLAWLGAALVAVAAATIGAPGHAAGAATRVAPTAISTAPVEGLGTVLVDEVGHRTLYVFLPDRRKHDVCGGLCATFWVPLELRRGQTRALVDGKARASLVGSVPAAGGGRVVTYAGWPVYTYTDDAHAGLAKGQGASLPEPCTFLGLSCALPLDGPVSYALTPAGTIDRRRPGVDALGP
jgi:predicted lipoprotein with Yx(FWY)xxD motif